MRYTARSRQRHDTPLSWLKGNIGRVIFSCSRVVAGDKLTSEEIAAYPPAGSPGMGLSAMRAAAVLCRGALCCL